MSDRHLSYAVRALNADPDLVCRFWDSLDDNVRWQLFIYAIGKKRKPDELIIPPSYQPHSRIATTLAILNELCTAFNATLNIKPNGNVFYVRKPDGAPEEEA